MIRLTSTPLSLLSLPALWAAGALVAVASGVYYAPPGSPSRAIAVQLVALVALFWAAARWSPAVRRAVAALDPARLTALQSWRVLGMMFLFLMALGKLPPVFAVPAGVGDVLVGLAAPLLALRLRDGTASRRSMAWFTALGLADFVAAFGFGNWVNLHPEHYAGFASMSEWPLVLVPALFVPAFALLHLAAWISFDEREAGAASMPGILEDARTRRRSLEALAEENPGLQGSHPGAGDRESG